MSKTGERRDAATLASLLARYMEERGLSQRQLAERAGLSPATLNRWLNGRSERPYHRGGVLALAAALGLPRVSANRLLRAAGLPPVDAVARAPSAEERALLERWLLPVRSTLPADLTSFVGRVDEVAAVAELLCRDDVRLVTLTGTGGSGKTRLAIRAAAEARDAFPDGVYFVPLAAVSEPALVVRVVAEAAGLRDVLDAWLLERLAGWLGTRRVLLLLDNLEQVITCGPDVVGLLRAAPGAKVLATSRVPLHVSGEHAWPVDPFPVPEPAESRRALLANPAVELFRERAWSANPRRALDDVEELAAVAELCTRLDGLPLAIELAAARTREWSPERLLAEFPNRLELGAAGPRDVPPRQQALRAAIAWSLDLLPEEARVLLPCLAIFVGGWTEEAAAAVCAPDLPGSSVARVLARLVDASLILRPASSGGAGETRRYRMLETIREYGLELLAASGEEAVLRERHARHFLALAESAPPYVPEVREGDWYARVDADLDNVRAALTWASERDDPAPLAHLCAALWPYWHEYLRVEEGCHWLERVLANDVDLPAALRASILTGACTLTFPQSDYAATTAYGEAALALWLRLSDDRGQALVLQQLGWARLMCGDTAAIPGPFTASLDAWRRVGDERGIGCALLDLALTTTSVGDLEMATSYLAAAEERYRIAGDERGLARLRRERGLLALLHGDLPAAVSLLRDAVERLGASGRTYLVPPALFYLGTALYLSGALDEALAIYTESLDLHEEIGDRAGLSHTLLGFAAVAHRQGDGTRAAVLCGAAERTRQLDSGTLPAAMLAIYEREVAMVVDQIGPDRFAEGFARGAEMSTAEALALARQPVRDR